MNGAVPHVTVLVCTFRRPAMLRRLLADIDRQRTDDRFTVSVIVVDNDRSESAKEACCTFRRNGRTPLEYFVEPEQNIALARNRAIESACGDLVALIDDDEIPRDDWLLSHYSTLVALDADGVLGPVNPRYELNPPPKWLVRAGFYERPQHETGTLLNWTQTRTGNCLLRRHVFNAPSNRFRPDFGMGGEDRELFRRLIGQGFRFHWCAEAAVEESVPAARCRRSFLMRRALLRGTIPQFTYIDFVKSLAAVPLYTVGLPFSQLAGHHWFMLCLVKDCDHIGRLFAMLGVKLIKDKYVVE